MYECLDIFICVPKHVYFIRLNLIEYPGFFKSQLNFLIYKRNERSHFQVCNGLEQPRKQQRSDLNGPADNNNIPEVIFSQRGEFWTRVLMMKLLAVLWSAHSPSFGSGERKFRSSLVWDHYLRKRCQFPVLGRGDSHIPSTHNCTVYCLCTVDGVGIPGAPYDSMGIPDAPQ